jgi:signal transduction histidine kinase
VSRVLDRLPRPVRDWGVVGVLLVLIEAEILVEDVFAEHRVLAILFAAGFVLPFGVRGRWPLGALAVAWGSCVVGSVAVASFYNLEWPFLLIMWTALIAGRIPALRRSLLAVGTGFAGLVAVNLTNPDAVLGDYLFPGGFVLAMWTVSRTIHTRTLLAAELHEEALRAQERREQATARAVADERRRIAREMHDLVGHSVSVMVVQAGGARRILDRDPERAIEAAVRIEQTGRAALAEMRRLLGLLGTADAESLAPQPTLDGLAALAERARGAGLPVELVCEGERRPLPAGAEAAAYRIVQEALTNVLKHAAGAPTTVLVRSGPDALELEVADAGRARAARAVEAAATDLGSGGHGLVGMRERVKVYGGELSAEPRRDGGFVVRAEIPWRQEELQAA